MEQPELVNRVSRSGLVTIDLEAFYPEGEIAPFDLKDYLFMGLILKEKDFREALKAHDWAQYSGKNVAVFCSTDAIIPMWAYMLVTAYAAPYARDVFQGTPEQFVEAAFLKKLAALDLSPYQGKRLVIKGCSTRPVPSSAYVEITRRLQPIALSIMYGEPCSTVPVYKRLSQTSVQP
ncbi:MAG: DUF2480 family protein [Saprospiraceae bacterium]|nr:DUF2480 family protein [Saprospiraceae bacterium]MDW8483399.1 DUF2480 family protein [Saprospiraceae bacterium]